LTAVALHNTAKYLRAKSRSLSSTAAPDKQGCSEQSVLLIMGENKQNEIVALLLAAGSKNAVDY